MGAEAVFTPQHETPEFVEHGLSDGFGQQAHHGVAETLQVRVSERSTRVIDHDGDSSMEQKKREGYF